jgi:hypothetical protein
LQGCISLPLAALWYNMRMCVAGSEALPSIVGVGSELPDVTKGHHVRHTGRGWAWKPRIKHNRNGWL